MPLHDWSDLPGWDGVHLLWIAELLRWVKPRLPEGYRAYVGTAPTFAIGGPSERPDVGVLHWQDGNGSGQAAAPADGPGESPARDEPDEEVAVTTLEGDKALFVAEQGRLVAAVELVSPRNKDRTSACAANTARYAGYLRQGVHLVLVDVHRRPLRFSFADRIAEELQMTSPPLPAPFAVSYRVGEPAPTGGRFLAVWRRPLAVGSPLPTISLPLTVHQAVPVDLETTYMRAAADAYLA